MFGRSALCTTALLCTVLVGAPGAFAQDGTLQAAKLLLTTSDGRQMEYTVGDASFYVSTSAGYEGVPATVDFSASLSSVSPVDKNLLEWSSQAPGKHKQAAPAISIIGTVGDGSEVFRYEITGTEVTSVSFSQSTYAAPNLSVSLTGGKLTVNGVAVN